jgi:hypothetical protein
MQAKITSQNSNTGARAPAVRWHSVDIGASFHS